MKLNARNFFLNVSDLQGICTALGLPTDDLKPQLIGRILNFASMSNTDDNDEYDDAETDETLINTASMSTQTEEIQTTGQTSFHKIAQISVIVSI